MEMTFPHSDLRQEPATGHKDYKAMLAAVVARQTNSRTVRALRRAERLTMSDNHVDRCIHYFAQNDVEEMPVSGAFWASSEPVSKSESAVYQAGSTNIKDHELNHVGTGDQSNLVGHGVLRTL